MDNLDMSVASVGSVETITFEMEEMAGPTKGAGVRKVRQVSQNVGDEEMFSGTESNGKRGRPLSDNSVRAQILQYASERAGESFGVSDLVNMFGESRKAYILLILSKLSTMGQIARVGRGTYSSI